MNDHSDVMPQMAIGAIWLQELRGRIEPNIREKNASAVPKILTTRNHPM